MISAGWKLSKYGTEKERLMQTLSAPAGLHYCEMNIQAGAPPVELIGRLAS